MKDTLHAQRRYFSRPARSAARMAPMRRPYEQRHLRELLSELRLAPGARLLELGCGMGRFSLLLADRGFAVTGVDLSPQLLDVLARHDPNGRIRRLCCDAAGVDQHLESTVDAALGFFFLHHLERPEETFASLARVLEPGARIAFCEPNGWNPLFYLQVLLTPGMSFRVDRGLQRMRRSALAPRLEAAGFGAIRCRRYGLFPPRLANHPVGSRLERRLERLRPPLPFSAFLLVSATRSDV